LSKFSWEVSLKANYKFSDGTPVTAKHVGDALTRLNQKNSGAQASLGTMTMTPLDDLRLQIDSERATPVMTAVLAEWPFVVYLEKGGKSVFTGPYAIETFVENDRFDLVPNPHYPRALERPRLVIKKFASGQLAASALEVGWVDMAFHVPVESLPDLRQMNNITVKSFPVGYQYMMWHNTRRSPLSDLKVRKAVDIAIDRHELTQEVRGGKATRSLFPENTPYFLEETQLHADRSGAEQLLDEAGWVKNAAGIREKAGIPLTISIVAYPQRPALPTMVPVIKRSLAALGIQVTTRVTSGQSWDELDSIIVSKDFDLMLWAQHTLPAGDPQFFINAFFRSNTGNNHAGLASPEIDGLIDALAHTETAADRVSATVAAHKAIHAQVPVRILMTPSWHVGLGSRLANYQPWGSDYYVIHADFGLGESNTVGLQADTTSLPSAINDVEVSATHLTFTGVTVAIFVLFGLLL
jgi:peptide/nickel transport system substrate-binding protein